MYIYVYRLNAHDRRRSKTIRAGKSPEIKRPLYDRTENDSR